MRGHVIRVRAPWVKANYFINEDNYILPNLNTVVLIPHPFGAPLPKSLPITAVMTSNCGKWGKKVLTHVRVCPLLTLHSCLHELSSL